MSNHVWNHDFDQPLAQPLGPTSNKYPNLINNERLTGASARSQSTPRRPRPGCEHRAVQRAVSSAGGSNCVGVVARCGRCSSIQAPRGQPSVKAPRASRRRRKGKAHMSGWRISPDAGEGQERVVVLDDDLPTLVRPAGPQRHEERMGALRQVVKAAAPADWATGHMHARVLSAHQTTWLTNHSVGYSSRSCSVK